MHWVHMVEGGWVCTKQWEPQSGLWEQLWAWVKEVGGAASCAGNTWEVESSSAVEGSFWKGLGEGWA
jgi:hypothetical protein